MIAQLVHFSGRVQGVGFRFTACDIARGFDVYGYIRNLPDGRVELLAQGQPDELDAFIDAVSSRMKRLISGVVVSEVNVEEEFTEFSLRY